MNIQIGNLNRRLQVMKLSHVPDGGGGYDDQLVPVATVWGSITPILGREFWEAQQTQVQLSHKIIIRYTKGIDRTCLIVYGDRTFDVQYITNLDEANRFLEIRVLERQPKWPT